MRMLRPVTGIHVLLLLRSGSAYDAAPSLATVTAAPGPSQSGAATNETGPWLHAAIVWPHGRVRNACL